jgi:predicted  nucleic acid-binding Zn-ribbon protein
LKDLQARVEEKEGELRNMKNLLTKHNAERDRAEARWREQLASANALTKQLEADCAEATERDARIRQELASARKEREELQSRLKAEQSAVEDGTRRAEDLERRMHRLNTEHERARVEIEKLEKALGRSETEWRERLAEATEQARQFEAAWTDASDECKRFAEQLAALKEERDELRAKLFAAGQMKGRGGKAKKSKSAPYRPAARPPATKNGIPRPAPPAEEPPANGDFAQIHQYDFSGLNGDLVSHETCESSQRPKRSVALPKRFRNFRR